MRNLFLSSALMLTTCLPAFAQPGNLLDEVENGGKKEGKPPVTIFNGQKLINANTVEILPKGRLEFKVQHNFGNIGGSTGGVQRFFGLDNAADIKIGFQMGLAKNFNLLVARTRGGGAVSQLWELGLKYQLLQQRQNDPSHPLSIAVFANGVVSSQKANVNPNTESSFSNFSDRGSSLLQLMVARKFGGTNGISLQVNPSFVRRNYVEPGDENNTFAMGGAVRIPLSKKFIFIADYFHPFRSSSSKNALLAKGERLYDIWGAGFEIKTPGHLFYFNLTNATNLLENRFIPRTFSNIKNGEFRWGFTISRDFVLFRSKK